MSEIVWADWLSYVNTYQMNTFPGTKISHHKSSFDPVLDEHDFLSAIGCPLLLRSPWNFTSSHFSSWVWMSAKHTGRGIVFRESMKCKDKETDKIEKSSPNGPCSNKAHSSQSNLYRFNMEWKLIETCAVKEDPLR